MNGIGRRPILTPKPSCSDLSLLCTDQLLVLTKKALTNKDYTSALEICFKMMNGGNGKKALALMCQVIVGGSEEERELIFNYCQQASDEGSPSALFMVSYCYRYGYGVVRDESKELQFLEIAAKNNCSKAQELIADRNKDGADHDLLAPFLRCHIL